MEGSRQNSTAIDVETVKCVECIEVFGMEDIASPL